MQARRAVPPSQKVATTTESIDRRRALRDLVSAGWARPPQPYRLSFDPKREHARRRLLPIWRSVAYGRAFASSRRHSLIDATARSPTFRPASPPSGPLPRSPSAAIRLSTASSRARSSAVEHYVDIVGVTGSIPVAPTSVWVPLSSAHRPRVPLQSGCLGGSGIRRHWQMGGWLNGDRTASLDHQADGQHQGEQNQADSAGQRHGIPSWRRAALSRNAVDPTVMRRSPPGRQ